MVQRPGICPRCHGDNLNYASMEPEDDNMVYYPYVCEDCGYYGEEWYKLVFTGHEDDLSHLEEEREEN